MTIVYLHGFRSTANCDKARITKKMFPEHDFIALTYCPHNPHQAAEQISTLAKAISSTKNTVVIGSSLGGFWARWMSYKFGMRSLLINPSLHPDKTLNTAGEYEIFDGSGNTIEVTENGIAAFKLFKLNAEDAIELDCSAWIASDDEVIDAKATFEQLEPFHKVTMFETGGHRFSQFVNMRAQIEELL